MQGNDFVQSLMYNRGVKCSSVEVSPTLISNVTDSVLEEVRA